MVGTARLSRRQALQGIGAVASAAALGLRAKPAGAGISGDTLVIGQTGDIVSLDPAFRVDTLTGIIQKHL